MTPEQTHAEQLSAIRRSNALMREAEEMLAVCQRVIEWEQAGYVRGGKTISRARALLARIDSAQRVSNYPPKPEDWVPSNVAFLATQPGDVA